MRPVAIAPESYGLVELVLVFSIILGLAVWELVRLRRSQREDQRREERDRRSKAENDDSGRGG